jgi:hypothetical protein
MRAGCLMLLFLSVAHSSALGAPASLPAHVIKNWAVCKKPQEQRMDFLNDNCWHPLNPAGKDAGAPRAELCANAQTMWQMGRLRHIHSASLKRMPGGGLKRFFLRTVATADRRRRYAANFTIEDSHL